MKTSFPKLFCFLFIGMLFLYASCIKQETIVPSSTNTEMFCKVDGEQWISIVPLAFVTNNHLLISAVSIDDELVSLSISDATEGTYSLDPNSSNLIAYEETGDDATLSFASNRNTSNTNYGTVVITKHDLINKTISGTFETEVHRSSDGAIRSITEGSFNDLAYSEVVFPTATQLSATIDSAFFGATLISDSLALGNLFVQGGDTIQHKIIELSFPTTIAVGVYDLGSPGLSDYSAQYNLDSITFMPADSGQLLITEHLITDKYIKGIFNFNATESGGTQTANISNGFFELTYE